MNNAIISAPLRRFAWKEYRTLRGLWLAVLLLGMLVDWVSGVLVAPPADWAGIRLCIALASATLYAAGAAAILFSMEHEDQTYDFLRGLPMTWLPVFVGKLLLATVSAVALAAVLALIGLVAGGFRWPEGNNASLALGIFGITIFEAIAWGTLCSLLFKRALVAAIVTLVVGALAVHLAVNATGMSDAGSADPHSYVTAAWLRIVIIVVVLGLCVAVARNWLSVGSDAKTRSFSRVWGRLTGKRAMVDAPTEHVGRGVGSPRRRSMLTRLVWQSWRESWKLLPLPVLVAWGCMTATMLSANWTHAGETSEAFGIATMFFCPALYGAFVFSADQRRGNVRFLAEHAAAPRFVWLSRQIMWLGTISVLLMLIAAALAAICVRGIQIRWAQHPGLTPTYFVQDLLQVITAAEHVTALALCGVLSAYAIGQFCSMLLRSEILAGFVALVLSAVMSGWVAVLYVWGLSTGLFLLPLAAAFLLATWLRAPDWVVGRNGWRAWSKPALAIAGAITMLGLLLPVERLAQIGRIHLSLPYDVREALTPWNPVDDIEHSKAEAAATAEMYTRAATMLFASVPDDPLAPWSGPEYAEPVGAPGDVYPIGGIDEARIPIEQKTAFLAARKKWEVQSEQQRAGAIKLAIEASERPTCQFSFHLSATRFPASNRYNPSWMETGEAMRNLDYLLNQLMTFSPDGNEGNVQFEHLLAALRMNVHMRSGQPTVIYIRQLQREEDILNQIGKWAVEKDRTNKDRRTAIRKLQEYFLSHQDLFASLEADRKLIREVITGKELPFVLSEEPIPVATHLAYLANELPWERERALVALDVITVQNLTSASGLTAFLTRPTAMDNGREYLRRWLRPDFQPAWMTEQPQAVSSYLVSFEYNHRVAVNELFRQYCDTTAWERALVLKIALAIYRHDHKVYPATLAELTPEYVDPQPLDPYSTQPFSYLPHGLDKPLLANVNSEQVTADAHVPLLWSVGPNGLHFQRQEYEPLESILEKSADVRVLAGGFYMQEESLDNYLNEPSNLLFALPK